MKKWLVASAAALLAFQYSQASLIGFDGFDASGTDFSYTANTADGDVTFTTTDNGSGLGFSDNLGEAAGRVSLLSEPTLGYFAGQVDDLRIDFASGAIDLISLNFVMYSRTDSEANFSLTLDLYDSADQVMDIVTVINTGMHTLAPGLAEGTLSISFVGTVDHAILHFNTAAPDETFVYAVDNVASIPEPAAVSLILMTAVGGVFIRRRFL